MESNVQSGANRAEEYKRRAADCIREAGCVSDDMLRQAYFQMARVWNKMADKANSYKYIEVSKRGAHISCDVGNDTQALRTASAGRANPARPRRGETLYIENVRGNWVFALSAAIILSTSFPASAVTRHHRVTQVHPEIYNTIPDAIAGTCSPIRPPLCSNICAGPGPCAPLRDY